MNKNTSQVCHSTNKNTTRNIFCLERSIFVLNKIKNMGVYRKQGKINKCANMNLKQESGIYERLNIRV
jgi:hypothetical protein